MTRPKIVHVYKDVYPPVEGGIERTIYHLCRLTAERFDPSVIVASTSTASRRRRVDDAFDVLEVPSLGRAMSTPLAPGFIGALRGSRADLFHFHFPHPTGEVAYLLSRLSTPAVVTYHSDVVRQRAALALYRPFMHRFLSRMKVIMPTSQRYLETSESLAVHRDRCRVVPLGLPLEDYAPKETIQRRSAELRAQFGPFIFFIGVLRYYKGLHVLVEAMRLLPEARLVVAGEGPEGRRLRALANALGDRIHFAGRIDHAEAVAHFHAAEVFCLPATLRSEAFGLCQVEALACGLPIVSTDLPTGVPEVNRHGETGLIVPPGQPEPLAEALRTILADSDLRGRLSVAARARAENCYTARRMADGVMRVYEDVQKSPCA